MKITLTTGCGLKFNGNKLTTDVIESDLLVKKSDGIYIPSLVGNDGTNGGSVVDGLTIKGTSNSIEGIDRDNVISIFSISAFKLSSHVSTDGTTLPLVGNTESSHVKMIEDIVSEINFDCTNNICYQTQYHIYKNDLLLLKDVAVRGKKCESPDKNNQYMEDGNRYLNSIPYALFTIDDVSYSTNTINNIRDWTCKKFIMTCVWVTNSDTKSADAVRSIYMPGQVYQYN